MAERGLLVASNNFLAASMSSGKTKSKQDIPGILSCSTPTRSQKYLPANAIRPLSSISTEPASEKGMAAVPLSWMGTKKLYRHDLIRAIQMDRLPTCRDLALEAWCYDRPLGAKKKHDRHHRSNGQDRRSSGQGATQKGVKKPRW